MSDDRPLCARMRPMPPYWIEVNGAPEPCDDVRVWAAAQESKASWLASDVIDPAPAYGRPVRLSTRFLGMDLSWGGAPEPLCYGTGLLPQRGASGGFEEWLHPTRAAALRFHNVAKTQLVAGERVRRVVFVFGSNLAGRHGKGAALEARVGWGAEPGVGRGRTGDAYAIPTRDARLRTRPLRAIGADVAAFLDYADANPDLEFLVTRVGCGLAGYSERQIRPLFGRAPENCRFTWEEATP